MEEELKMLLSERCSLLLSSASEVEDRMGGREREESAEQSSP
jgi:hypothetical protein